MSILQAFLLGTMVLVDAQPYTFGMRAMAAGWFGLIPAGNFSFECELLHIRLILAAVSGFPLSRSLHVHLGLIEKGSDSALAGKSLLSRREPQFYDAETISAMKLAI